jgi:hypothetical protein
LKYPSISHDLGPVYPYLWGRLRLSGAQVRGLRLEASGYRVEVRGWMLIAEGCEIMKSLGVRGARDIEV